MKLILTEEQFNGMIFAELLSNYFQNNLINESIDVGKLKKKIKIALISGVSALSILAAVNNLNVGSEIKSELKNEIKEIQSELAYDDSLMIRKMDSIREEKINAVREFMNIALTNQGYSLSQSKLSPEAIVDSCEKENFDIPFVMAAANLESCFGVTKRAGSTNSVFSVGCYDNGKNKVKYKSQNDCIIPYIKLLKNDYLIDGKTIGDLLKPGCFVNFDGKRYASNKNYEKQLASIRNKIIKKYPILVN